MFRFFITWYKEIDFDEDMSKSKDEVINKMVYAKEYRDYGESRSYHVQFDENKNATLVPNHRSKKGIELKPIPAGTEDYIFVIVLDKDNKPQLRIGMGSHYFLSNKSDQVIAAGTISFKKNKIEEITDKSGGFHIKYNRKIKDVDELTKDEKDRFRHSFVTALKSVGLPTNKFKPAIKVDSDSPTLSSKHR